MWAVRGSRPKIFPPKKFFSQQRTLLRTPTHGYGNASPRPMLVTPRTTFAASLCGVTHGCHNIRSAPPTVWMGGHYLAPQGLTHVCDFPYIKHQAPLLKGCPSAGGDPRFSPVEGFQW